MSVDASIPDAKLKQLRLQLEQQMTGGSLDDRARELMHQYFESGENVVIDSDNDDDDAMVDSDDDSDDHRDDTTNAKREKRLVFRNYEPRDNHLKRRMMKGSNLNVTSQDTMLSFLESVEEGSASMQGDKRVVGRGFVTNEQMEKQSQELLKRHIGDLIAVAKAVESSNDSGDQHNPLNLIPQKVNWDLKREVLKKLQVLERQTMASIADIVKENMEDDEDEDSVSDDDSDSEE